MAQSNRGARVEANLQRELAGALMRGALRDPRLKPSHAVSITAVRVARDLSSARVYVDVLGIDARAAVAALNAGAARLRHELAPRLQLRHVPALTFFIDESIANGARMEELFASLKTERDQQARAATQVDADASEADEAEADGDGAGGEVDASPVGRPESTDDDA